MDRVGATRMETNTMKGIEVRTIMKYGNEILISIIPLIEENVVLLLWYSDHTLIELNGHKYQVSLLSYFFLLPSNEDILLKTNKKSADKKGKKEFFDFIVHFLPFVFILEEN